MLRSVRAIMGIEDKYSLAFKNFQEGNFEQAETDCREILQSDPENADILHLLGLTFFHRGSNELAVEYLEKALRQEPDNADFFYDLGNVHQSEGRHEDAIESYRKALECEPEHADAHNNLGIALHDQGKLAEALAHYQKALELTPQNPFIHNNLGLLYQEQEEYTKAIAHYGRAIQLDPHYADVYYNMGHVFMKEQKPDQAFQYFRKSAELNPSLAEAHLNMAVILVKAGKFVEAIPLLKRLAMSHPDSAEIHNSLGNALTEVWRLDEATSHLRRAVELTPESAESWNNLGRALGRRGDLNEASAALKKALELQPNMTDALVNLGNVFKEQGRYSEAAGCYHDALKQNPDAPDALLGMALIDLLHGRFERGWEGYAARLIIMDGAERHVPQPEWDGSSLRGKKIFISAERGIGDEIMFASCIHEVMEKAEFCFVECSELLAPIFERSFPGTAILKRLEGGSNPAHYPAADFKISSGGLPKFLRPDIRNFPDRKSYLVPDAIKVGTWKSRFEELGAGLKVGVSWRGAGTPDMVRVRSTTIDEWAELFGVAGTHFVSLQYGDCTEELRDAGDRLKVKIHDWQDADPLKDLDAFAAKIAALDLVISVDNATVHMTGALGVPVWILLPYACDWRWMLECEDSPWYPSARLFRQKSPGDWKGVFDRLLGCLRESALAGRVVDVRISKSYKGGLSQA